MRRKDVDLTPEQRMLRMRQAAGRQSAELRLLHTGEAMPPAVRQMGHAAQWARLETVIDPDGVLDAADRDRRAKAGWHAWMRARRNKWTTLPLRDWIAAEVAKGSPAAPAPRERVPTTQGTLEFG